MMDLLKNEATGKFDTLNPGKVTAEYNSEAGGNANNSPATLPIWERYGVPYEDTKCSFRNKQQNGQNCNDDDSREYVLVNNPQVAPLGNSEKLLKVKLQLAVNTAQYGRTFQDRTHSFILNKRPDIPTEAEIQLVTVSGKRGNIVQTFPGHEYFFIPEVARFNQGDYLHLEISGSDTNPNNNDGQGRKGTDRSNICPMSNKNYEGGDDTETEDAFGAPGNNYPAFVKNPSPDYAIPQITRGKPRELKNEQGEVTGTEQVKCNEPDHYQEPIGGMDTEVASALCTGRLRGKENIDYGNMEELDDAGTAFTMEPIKMNKVGCWNYISTRNNNFSNRSQKGKMCVDSGLFASTDVGSNGGVVQTTGGWLAFKEGSLDTIYSVSFETSTDTKTKTASSPTITINPPELSFPAGESAELGIDYSHRALRTPKVMHKAVNSDSWSEVSGVDWTKRDGKTVAIFQINSPGEYKVEDEVYGGSVAAIVIIGLILLCTIGALVYVKVFKEKPENQESFNSGIQGAI